MRSPVPKPSHVSVKLSTAAAANARVAWARKGGMAAAHVKVEARMLFGEVELLLRVLVLRDAAG